MKRSFSTIATCLLFCTSLWAAITYVAGDNFSQGTSSATHTFSGFTVSANSSKILLDGILINANGSDQINSVTFNGDSLTVANTVGSGAFSAAAVYYRLQPDEVTGDAVANLAASYRGFQTLVVLSGVDQSSPFRDGDTDSGTTETSSDITLTTVAGDFVLSCIGVRNAPGDPGALVPNGHDAEIEELLEAGGNYRGSCLRKVATGTSTLVGWDWTTATGWAHVAVVVKPSANITVLLDSQNRQRRQ